MPCNLLLHPVRLLPALENERTAHQPDHDPEDAINVHHDPAAGQGNDCSYNHQIHACLSERSLMPPSLCSGRAGQPIFLNFAIQALPVNAQQPRRLVLIAPTLVQGGGDEALFHLFQARQPGLGLKRGRCGVHRPAIGSGKSASPISGPGRL